MSQTQCHDSSQLLPQAAFAAALACLPAVGPKWLASTLLHYEPSQAWAKVVDGSLVLSPASSRSAPAQTGRAEDWASWALRFDVRHHWQRCTDKGIDATWRTGPGYPTHLGEGPMPCGVLFVTGDMTALVAQPSVAIIGTRRCSTEGAATAFEMGYELAQAGVCVVSGLALGIDGAAHSGAITAMREAGDGVDGRGLAVGVAASGVDVVYPSQHAALWRQVSRLGAVVSETPPGYPAQSWRFPSRNRIIAGLVDVVVVVECHIQSGSWHTVDAALARSTTVAAVPGPVKAGSCAGTNRLLREGATFVRHAQDVLDVLGYTGRRPARPGVKGPAGAAGPFGPIEKEVLSALNHRPLTVDDLVERSGLPLAAVALALEHLADRGAANEAGGWWSKRA